MKYTLFLTERCNLACSYCYVGKSTSRMTLDRAERIIAFAFGNTPASEDIDIGFFGGEPLLEFPLLCAIVEKTQARSDFDPCRVKFSVVSNGLLVTPQVAEYLKHHNVSLNISCDGPPTIHNQFRRFHNGAGSAHLVERGIRAALKVFGLVPVNAVYRPENFHHLPATVDYLSSLGVRQIHLNADYSAAWTEAHANAASSIYRSVAQQYTAFYREGRPHFISLIDSKIALLLRGGYHPMERCRMGKGEFAFSPAGHIYPCERLAGSDPGQHSIGSSDGLIRIGELRDHFAGGGQADGPCLTCGIRDYCMNWCGCSNYFSSASYDRAGPFLCASERAAVEVALEALKTLEEELGPVFMDHLGGHGVAPSLTTQMGRERSGSMPQPSRQI